jgi:hypothetical protein
MASYAIFVVFAGATAVRDASGLVEDLSNGTQYDCYPNRNCDWGLMNSYSVSKNVCSEHTTALNLATALRGPKQFLNIAFTTFLTGGTR